jgi:antiviral helicase SLH1
MTEDRRLMSPAGMPRDIVIDDPHLGAKRTELIVTAARKLADAGMIVFDQPTGAFTITDLGRIAARYYVRHSSVEIFNKLFRPKMSEADVLAMLSESTEVILVSTPHNSLFICFITSSTKYRFGSRS